MNSAITASPLLRALIAARNANGFASFRTARARSVNSERGNASFARGTWALYNYLFNEKQKRGIWIGAFYHDEYVKIGDEWKQRHVGYQTIFHQEWSFDDLPSLRSNIQSLKSMKQ